MNDTLDPMALYDIGVDEIDPNQTYCIEAQEIFEIGTHKGLPYTGTNLQSISDNFKRFYFSDPVPLLMPPAVVGHEEDQEILKRSDLPAAGWVKACFLDGTKLKATIGEIPGQVMLWIKRGLLRTLSAEIYEDSGDAGLPEGHGPTLRRVAFIGGDVPQVKTLARLKIPKPEKNYKQFNEDRVKRITIPLKNVRFFSESKPPEGKQMNKNKLSLFDEMKKDGIDDESVKKMSDMGLDDGTLQKMSACMKKFFDAPAPQSGDPGFDRAAAIEMIASKNGIDRAALEDKTDDELKALMGPASMSDKAEDPTKLKVGESQAPEARVDDRTVAPKSTSQAEAVVQQHSDGKGKPARKHTEGDDYISPEVRNRLSRMEQQLDEQKRRERIAALKNKQTKVNKFCESAIAEGKITPAEVSGGLKDILMGMDDERVRKFSDGRESTELDKQIDLIKARPKLHVFSEKLSGDASDSPENDAYIKKLKSSTASGRKALARETAAAKS